MFFKYYTYIYILYIYFFLVHLSVHTYDMKFIDRSCLHDVSFILTPAEKQPIYLLFFTVTIEARQSSFNALIRCAARNSPAVLEALIFSTMPQPFSTSTSSCSLDLICSAATIIDSSQDALGFFERRLKNEQDNIRILSRVKTWIMIACYSRRL